MPSVKPLRSKRTSAALFFVEPISPCVDGTVIAMREGNLIDLVKVEEANSAVFFADP